MTEKDFVQLQSSCTLILANNTSNRACAGRVGSVCVCVCVSVNLTSRMSNRAIN